MAVRIGIIGVGHVGAHCALSLCMQGLCDELVLVDIDRQKAASEALDLGDCAPFFPHRVRITVGSCADIGTCDIAVISMGIHKGTGCVDIQHRSRLQGLEAKAGLVDSVVPQVVAAGFRGIFIVISNPCDIIAHRVWRKSGFDWRRVFATGTTLDSARLCRILSGKTGYDAKSITGFTLGEHGDSQIVAWSHVTVGGRPLSGLPFDLTKEEILREVRRTAWSIADGKGATEFGIAAVLSRIVSAVVHDENAVLPLSALLQGQYGMDGVFASTPCVLNRGGIAEVTELKLPEAELQGFRRSCEILRGHIRNLEA